MFEQIFRDPQGILPESRKNPPFSEARRIASSSAEIRQEEGSKRIGGRCIVYNEWVPIGPKDDPWWMERIKAGAFSDSLRDDDQLCFWQHNDALVLGRKSAETLTFEDSEEGLDNIVDPPSWASGYVETIERGDVRSQSFGFTVTAERWEEREGMEWREIEKGILYESSFVTYPANESTTAMVMNALRSAGFKDEALLAEASDEFDPRDVLRAIVSLKCKRELTDIQREALDRCFGITSEGREGKPKPDLNGWPQVGRKMDRMGDHLCNLLRRNKELSDLQSKTFQALERLSADHRKLAEDFRQSEAARARLREVEAIEQRPV